MSLSLTALFVFTPYGSSQHKSGHSQRGDLTNDVGSREELVEWTEELSISQDEKPHNDWRLEYASQTTHSVTGF